MKSDGRLYSVAAPFSGSSRVRVYVMDPQIERMNVVYSDGLIGFDVLCDRVGPCSGGNYDDSLAPGATVSGLSRGGTLLTSQAVVLRGTTEELTAQERAPAPQAGRAGTTVNSGLVATASVVDRGVSARIGA